jgi:spore germination protein YaaH
MRPPTETPSRQMTPGYHFHRRSMKLGVAGVQQVLGATVAALLIAGFAQPLGAQRMESLWYSTSRESSTQSFLAHADRISMVAPQVFTLDSLGNISGHIDPRVVERAHEKGVKLVPLVMNPGFDQPAIHRVLNVPGARRRAIRSLAALCRREHLDGIQFDLENIHVKDKGAFTSFARESADSVHRAGCTLSAAVVPRLGEDPGPTSYHTWIFDNWRGAYDYKALADTLDFLSYMTYAQHTGGSPPGPVAGLPWMEASLRYLLSLGVPPAKVSLGIPAYSDYWYPFYDAKTGSRMRGRDLSYAEGSSLLAKRGLQPTWDEKQKAPRAEWEEAGVFEYLWLEDARAFAAKMELVTRYHLRGYSVWVLGLEDPATWDVIGRAAGAGR